MRFLITSAMSVVIYNLLIMAEIHGLKPNHLETYLVTILLSALWEEVVLWRFNLSCLLIPSRQLFTARQVNINLAKQYPHGLIAKEAPPVPVVAVCPTGVVSVSACQYYSERKIQTTYI
jgi:hypothetical protein